MSKVKIEGNASGSGTLTISAPNTDTDRTLTLPDGAGEVLVTDGTITIDDTNDRVGIGTDSPSKSLHIYNGASGCTPYGTGILIEDNATTYLEFNTPTGTQSGITWATPTQQTSGTLLYNTTDRYMRFGTAGSERMRIDSSGNVGIGTTSPSAALEVRPNAVIGNGTNGVKLTYSNGNSTGIIDTGFSSTGLEFRIQNSEKMRINSSGNVLFGCTSNPSATVPGSGFIKTSYDTELRMSTNITGGNSLVVFYNPNGQIGSIVSSGSSTSYNTSSDYRLKENVVDMDGAIDRVKALSPKRFNFISDEDDTTVDGFLAHEVSDVIPEAISGEKDATKEEEYEVTPAVLDDDGNVVTEAVMGTRTVPDYQGIDQSKLVPLLTGALQEAIAKIEELETRIETLENA